MLFMLIGFFCFELLPGTLLGLFSHDPDVFSIGIPAFRIIGLSFLPAVVSLLSPVFFQAIGVSLYLRQVRQWAGGVD